MVNLWLYNCNRLVAINENKYSVYSMLYQGLLNLSLKEIMLEYIWDWENSRDGQIEDILDLDKDLLMLVQLLQ